MAAAYVETVSGVSGPISLVAGRWRERASEYFWFSVCLVLFMVLGPFAAPIALGFVFSSQSVSANLAEPQQVEEE